MLHAGTTVLCEEPIVYAAANTIEFCNTCMVKRQHFKGTWQICGGCHSFAYCSKECQVKDWKRFHGYECDIMGTGGGLNEESQGDVLTRFYIRILILRHRYPKDYIKLMKLHMEPKEPIPQSVECFKRASAFVSAKAADPSNFVQVAKNIMWIVAINKWNVAGYIILNSRGFAIYEKGSRINHSCRPNCLTIRDGNRLHVKVLREEGLGAGEEILVSYVPAGARKRYRQYSLSKDYAFDCACMRCIDEADPVDARLDNFSRKFYPGVFDGMECNIMAEASTTPLVETLEKCKVTLQYMDAYVGPFSYRRHRILQALAIQAYWEGQHECAREFLPIYIEWEEGILPPNHPYIAMHKLLLARLSLHLDKDRGIFALELLNDIETVMATFWVEDSVVTRWYHELVKSLFRGVSQRILVDIEGAK